MFAGFPSTNTPAIQVWDFYNDVASSARNSVYLTDDCAPIQFFRTGNNNAGIEINVFLPTSPIEGKTITIVNQRFGTGVPVYLYIRTSDRSGSGSNGISYVLGQGGMLLLVYSKQVISFGTANGLYQSGWIALNQGSGSAANAYGVALGGISSTASGSYTAVIGGSGNSAGGQYGAVLGGINNSASGTGAVVVGGSANTAAGTSNAIIGATASTTTNQYAVVLGGSSHSAGNNYSVALGGTYGNTRNIIGEIAIPASANPIAAAQGVSQSAILILARETTDATTTTITSDTSSAGTTNQVILATNSAYYFKGSVIANVTGAGNTKAWTFEGAIKRGATAASTAIVGTVTTNVVAADAGASAWTIALAADTTNGGLQVNVTGQAATTIRWVCQVNTTEVTY